TRPPLTSGGISPARRLCGSGWGGEYGLARGRGNGLTVVSMLPGTRYVSAKALEIGPHESKRLYVPRTVQSGMRASSTSWNTPGIARVWLNGLLASRRATVSDSPHEIVCRPIRRKTGPLVKLK